VVGAVHTPGIADVEATTFRSAASAVAGQTASFIYCAPQEPGGGPRDCCGCCGGGLRL
jgi:hypothetical protein